MSIFEYVVTRDKFELEDSMELSFPCSQCVHRKGTDHDEPCVSCDHNLNSDDPDDKPF